ncbi:MAG: hypothetical protein PVG65_07045, partial [Candidatus Thorarchaeota archaeon]
MTYDVVGNIAVLKFDKATKKEKKKLAEKLLKQNNIKTVLEKTEKVKGRFRKLKTRFLAGEKTTETLHKENACWFKLDVDECYFSPRLSNERKEVANKIKKNDKVLVMFSGVAPYPIVISKLSKAKKVVSVELARSCNKYAKENVEINKVGNVEIIQGDVKKVVPKLKQKFEVIVMPPLNLKTCFLDSAFKVSKKGTRIFYYDFGRDVGDILEKVYRES